MELAPSIEKRSLESKNTSHYNFGSMAEAWFTEKLHQNILRIPVLISPVVMRRLKLKQIDASSFEKNRLILWEVKVSRNNSNISLERIYNSQEIKRWLRTKNYLINLLGFKVEVYVVTLISKNNGIIHFEKTHKLL